MRLPLRSLGERFMESRKFIFDPDRKSKGKYEDLAPSTKAYKQRYIGRVYPILFFSGALASSITEKSDPYNIFLAERKNLTIGTKLDYAPYLQEGTKKMPAREFLFWGPESRLYKNHPQVIKANRSMSIAMLTTVERMLAKHTSLKSAISTAEKETAKVFDG